MEFFALIIGIVIFVITSLLALAGRVHPEPQARRMGRKIGIAGIVILAIAFIQAATVSVPQRTVGIETTFGKVVGTKSPGLSFKAPWSKVEKMDATEQRVDYRGDSAIEVKLANNARAYLDISVRWNLKEEGAIEAYSKYRNADIGVIQGNVIDFSVRESLKNVISDYDPLNPESQATGNSSLGAYQEELLKALRASAGDSYNIESVSIDNIRFDAETQKRIDALASETAKTRTAEQAKKTAEQEAEANRILSESITDETNTSKCLDIVDRNGQSPLGCFPNNGVTPTTSVDK